MERAAHVVNWMRVDGKLGGFTAGVWRRGLPETSLRHSATTICVDRGQLFGCSCSLLFGPSVLNIFMSTCFQAASK